MILNCGIERQRYVVSKLRHWYLIVLVAEDEQYLNVKIRKKVKIFGNSNYQK